jgi:hypothetical protein
MAEYTRFGKPEQINTGWINMATALQKSLLRRYHTICHQLGLEGDQKEAIKDSYGVASSRNLSELQLRQIIDQLLTGKKSNKPTSEADRWRKRVMAAIGAWLRSLNKSTNADVIKAIACRASGCDRFNKIPVSKLRAIYYEFVRKGEATEASKQIKEDLLDYLKQTN